MESQEQQKIKEIHARACQRHETSYVDPDTDETVFTAYYLWVRGYCCQQGCRHCPYDGLNISVRYKRDRPV